MKKEIIILICLFCLLILFVGYLLIENNKQKREIDRQKMEIKWLYKTTNILVDEKINEINSKSPFDKSKLSFEEQVETIYHLSLLDYLKVKGEDIFK